MPHSSAFARAALLLAAWTCFAARAENLPTSAAEIDTLAQRVAGVGDAYAPKDASLSVDQRYQNVRIIAVYQTDQVPPLPEDAKR